MPIRESVESDSPFLEKERDWKALFRFGKGVLIAVGATVIGVFGYAAQQWVGNTAQNKADQAVAPFVSIGYQLQLLQRYEAVQDKNIEETQKKVETLQNDIAALKSQSNAILQGQEHTARNLDRLIEHFDARK
jgi:phage replication-related protein YjqB (UPF0714/DUF867 family)